MLRDIVIMKKLALILLIIFVQSFTFGQKSPHGKNFNIKCSNCHTTDSWKVNVHKIKFDHSTTGFKLIGQHKDVNCSSCHKSLKFDDAPTDCASCHTDIHQNSVGSDCASCHTPDSWMVSNVLGIHERSRFPLLGVHQTLDCSQCHKSASLLNFKPLGVTCYDCHKEQYLATTNPNHIQAEFSTNCEECHSVTSSSWAASEFNHDFFPLTGGHAVSNCFSCHARNTFSGLNTDCYSCHRSNYEATTNPNHIDLQYPTNCELCHTITTWTDATFDHNSTNFPLTGAHTSLSCDNCHSNGYTGTSTLCISCHQDKYNSAPEHVAQNYPTTCEQCHNTTTWSDVTFDHNTTNFPLTGAHTTVSCDNCHADGYAGTSTVCNDCHSSNYASTTNPNHQNLGLSTDCAVCHTTNPGWSPALFPNHNDYYQLLGAHANITDCASCHNGDYNNTPTICYDCHQSDYNNTNNPPHQSAQFPTDCESCHTQSAWVPSTFDHDGQYFPIYSGKHNGEWNTCADCHTNPNDYSVFSCITCHEHNQSDMNSEHSGVSGYVYESSACYSCHPTGGGDGEGGGDKNLKYKFRRR